MLGFVWAAVIANSPFSISFPSDRCFGPVMMPLDEREASYQRLDLTLLLTCVSVFSNSLGRMRCQTEYVINSNKSLINSTKSENLS
jgi:hypothetical protein